VQDHEIVVDTLEPFREISAQVAGVSIKHRGTGFVDVLIDGVDRTPRSDARFIAAATLTM
jgi:hypothetical protein